MMESALRAIWCERLYREFDNVLYQRSVRMRRALIAINDNLSAWATWDPNMRVIALSSRLLRKHSWDVVVEILKHEMAHQWVTENYGNSPGMPHGERFMTACRRLGVADWAARATGDLPETIEHWKDRALSLDEERMLKRVEKLLALADSTNEHEALVAMQRVREIYARYNVDRLRAGIRDGVVYLHVTRKQKKTSQAESMIFSILTEFFFVKVIMTSMFDQHELTDFRSAELIGTRENVLMAEYVYNYLWDQSQVLWETFKKKHKAKGTARASYLLGVLSGFRDKLAAENETTWAAAGVAKSDAKALVATSKAALDEWVDERYPRLSTRTFSTSYKDRGSFHAGHADGGKISLKKPLEKQESGNGGLRLLSGRS